MMSAPAVSVRSQGLCELVWLQLAQACPRLAQALALLVLVLPQLEVKLVLPHEMSARQGIHESHKLQYWQTSSAR